jgi:hypothetical protein
LSSAPPLRERAGLALAFLFLAATAGAIEPTDTSYLADLIHRATEAKLSEERYWHLLLHYHKNLISGYTSEQDDPGFFLASNGKTDPQAELNATLAQFFSAELVGRSRQPAQCAFVARYQWLKEKLSFDDDRLPPQPCERFQRWYVDFDAESVSLIFPSAFMNNPASMFGHSLLRIDQKGQTEQTRILAYTINYAADVPPDVGVEYAIRGIFGGYRGYFSTIPYYLKVQEYRDIENRDIWEYRLKFSEGQLRRLLMHAWELGNASFDYYFFKENCSYHLLSLLEIADPTLSLRDRFLFWTVPADTVRLLTEQQALVKDIAYRPSRSTQIKRKREKLSEEERGWLGRITEDASLARSDEFKRLALARQASVLDLASDYLRYRSVTDDAKAESYKEKNRTVLVARSELKVKSEDFAIEPFTMPPEQGHRTSRAGLGAGWRNDELFEELTVRAGYHDLLDPDPGYTPDAQIELAAFSLRHYERSDQVRLERVTLANVLSLSPMDSLFKSPSWKINAGLQTVRHDGCRFCSNGVLNGGVGTAVESHLLGREVYFAFAEAEANVSHAYEENHRIGGGGTVGLLANLTERWKLMLSGSYLRYALGEKSDDFRWFVGQRYTVSQNLAVRFEYNHRDHDNDVVFTVQAFF